MQLFDLASARNGAKIITREGHTAQLVAHVPDAADPNTRLVWLDVSDKELFTTNEQGKFYEPQTDSRDVFLAPPTIELWANLYRTSYGRLEGFLHESQELADMNADDRCASRVNRKAYRVEIEVPDELVGELE